MRRKSTLETVNVTNAGNMSTTNKKLDGGPHELDEERLIFKMKSDGGAVGGGDGRGPSQLSVCVVRCIIFLGGFVLPAFA